MTWFQSSFYFLDFSHKSFLIRLSINWIFESCGYEGRRETCEVNAKKKYYQKEVNVPI